MNISDGFGCSGTPSSNWGLCLCQNAGQQELFFPQEKWKGSLQVLLSTAAARKQREISALIRLPREKPVPTYEEQEGKTESAENLNLNFFKA